MRLDDQLQAFAFEERQQLIHRLEELRFCRLGRFRLAAELGVDHLDAEIDGDLDDPLPGPYGCLPLIFVRTGPAQHRQHRSDAHVRIGVDLLQLLHPGVVDPRVSKERDEVGFGRQFHPVITQARRNVGQLEDRMARVKHLRIKRQLHGRSPIRSGAVMPGFGSSALKTGCRALVCSRFVSPSSRTGTFSPVRSACTPASQTATAAKPSHAPGPSIEPSFAASTQHCNSVSYAAPKRSMNPWLSWPPQRPSVDLTCMRWSCPMTALPFSPTTSVRTS